MFEINICGPVRLAEPLWRNRNVYGFVYHPFPADQVILAFTEVIGAQHPSGESDIAALWAPAPANMICTAHIGREDRPAEGLLSDIRHYCVLLVRIVTPEVAKS
ncbi:MAG TPA: hypothetical protein VNU19_12815, partial [Candidatus Acidoferrum sp.]|nr:hypothetical protein [Candidatus Acidoferrum sp.]